MTARISTLAAVLVLASVVSACDQARPRAPKSTIASTREQPSAAERQAAAVLSIGASSTIDDTTDPYELAIACQVASEALAERVGFSSGLSGEQSAAIRQVVALFRQRVQGLGTARDRDAQQIEADQLLEREKDLEVADRIRAAMACIQRLRQT